MTIQTKKAISALRELSNDYSPVNDRLFEVATRIEMYGELSEKEAEELQLILADCLQIALGVTTVLTGAGYET